MVDYPTSFRGYGGGVIPQQNIYEASSIAKHTPGDWTSFSDGRRYRYAYNGGVALAAGHVIQSAPETTNYTNLVVAVAAAIGAKAVTITLGGVALTANQMTLGTLHVNAGTGLGYTYAIKGHSAQATTTGNVTINLFDPLVIALDTTSYVTLTSNLWSKVVTAPASTPTGKVVGVAICVVPINYYAWLQTRGPAAVETVGTLIVGNLAEAYTATTPGCVGPVLGNILPVVGEVMKVNITTTMSQIYLSIRE